MAMDGGMDGGFTLDVNDLDLLQDEDLKSITWAGGLPLPLAMDEEEQLPAMETDEQLQLAQLPPFKTLQEARNRAATRWLNAQEVIKPRSSMRVPPPSMSHQSHRPPCLLNIGPPAAERGHE